MTESNRSSLMKVEFSILYGLSPIVEPVLGYAAADALFTQWSHVSLKLPQYGTDAYWDSFERVYGSW